jgi:hypothetical protein
MNINCSEQKALFLPKNESSEFPWWKINPALPNDEATPVRTFEGLRSRAKQTNLKKKGKAKP